MKVHKETGNRPACHPEAQDWRELDYAASSDKVTCEKCIKIWNQSIGSDGRKRKVGPIIHSGSEGEK